MYCLLWTVGLPSFKKGVCCSAVNGALDLKLDSAFHPNTSTYKLRICYLNLLHMRFNILFDVWNYKINFTQMR